MSPFWYWQNNNYYSAPNYSSMKSNTIGTGFHLYLDSNGCLNLNISSIKHFNFAPFIEAHIANLIQAKQRNRETTNLQKIRNQPQLPHLLTTASFHSSIVESGSRIAKDYEKPQGGFGNSVRKVAETMNGPDFPESNMVSAKDMKRLETLKKENLSGSCSSVHSNSHDVDSCASFSEEEADRDYLGASSLVKRVGSSSFELLKEDFNHTEMQIIRRTFKYSGFPMKTKQSNKKLGYYENHCLKCSAKLIIKKNRVNTGLLIVHNH